MQQFKRCQLNNITSINHLLEVFELFTSSQLKNVSVGKTSTNVTQKSKCKNAQLMLPHNQQRNN